MENVTNSPNIDFASIMSRMESVGRTHTSGVPSRKAVIAILKDIQYLMFPEYFAKEEYDGAHKADILERVYAAVIRQITDAYAFSGKPIDDASAEQLAREIIKALPLIKGKLVKDITALYEGDPAASCPEEIVLCYPGFYAISIYRIAHEFYLRKIPFIPRLMTEFSHEKTGIDIHAGATIGEYFFIDHGTGIVIGETTTIGNNVKIYQGVTLGARSFELDEDGNPVKGIKRHPDIGNNVIIYANATILGGDTRIGDGCIVGGNVWITRSVEAGKKVYYRCQGCTESRNDD